MFRSNKFTSKLIKYGVNSFSEFTVTSARPEGGKFALVWSARLIERRDMQRGALINHVRGCRWKLNWHFNYSFRLAFVTEQCYRTQYLTQILLFKMF